MLAYTESSTQVEEYLLKLKSALCSKNFDIHKDLEVQFNFIEGEPGF